MKKQIIILAIGILCVSATTGFAQTTRKTAQEKIIRLEVENRVLNERVKSLTQEITSLHSQLAAAQAQHVQGKDLSQEVIDLKPYYVNAEIQQKCEQYPMCAKWVADTYKRFAPLQRYLKITRIEEKNQEYNQYSLPPASIDYSLYLYTNFDPEHPCIFYRSGKGNRQAANGEIIEVEQEGVIQTQFFLEN